MNYFLLAIFFASLCFILPVKTFLYFAIGFGLIYLLSTILNRSGFLPFVILVIISPLFEYITTVFTFPVRLWLSDVAANILSFINPGVAAAGNMISTGGNEFAVDPACMGLSMVTSGLLAATIMLRLHCQQRQVSFGLGSVSIYFLSVLLLLVLSNLFRIILLVQFAILPGNYLHDVAGILSFLVYCLLPLQVILKKLPHSPERGLGDKTPLIITKSGMRKNIFLAILLICATSFKMLSPEMESTNRNLPPTLNGYQINSMPFNVIKCQNDSSLVYVKRINGFYHTEHSPAICWRGSGYNFTRIKEEKIGNHKIYTAELHKGNGILYTAWWYDNGEHKTISQLEWRWKAMKTGKDYSIVNVTSDNKGVLLTQVADILMGDIFAELLK